MTIDITDIASYMNGPGRFANLAGAKLVQDFFSGSIDRNLGITDSLGVTRLTVAELKLAGNTSLVAAADFAVSQYSAGMSDADYSTRAFIWGTTNFSLSNETTFVWDGGDLYIENGSVVPLGDNFDFSSPNQYAQYLNDNYFKPNIDPYNIGRTVWFNFDETSVDQWVSTHSIAKFEAGDFATASAIASVFSFATEEQAWGAVTPELVGAALAVRTLNAEIFAEGGAVEYEFDGKDIIYGSTGDDLALSYTDNLVHPGAIGVRGAILVAGSGNDTVYGSSFDDVIYGGQGSDTLYGGAGNDRFEDNDDNAIDIIHGESGDDYIIAGNGDTVYGGEGADLIFAKHADIDGGDGSDIIEASDSNVQGGAGDDIIVVDGGSVQGGAGADTITYTLKGGNSAISVIDAGEGDDAVFIHSDESALFYFEADEGNDTFVMGANTSIELDYKSPAGNDIVITNGGNLSILSGSSNYSWDIDIDMDNLVFLDGDSDGSRWFIEFDLTLSFTEGSVEIRGLSGEGRGPTAPGSVPPTVTEGDFFNIGAFGLTFNNNDVVLI